MANENPVFEYITTEASAYKARRIPLTDNWDFSMYEHIKRSFSYKNSKFHRGSNDGNRPFKNITLPILRVAYRSEGFDLKDIVPYVNNDKDYDKSFFVKKFNEKWGFDMSLDTFIDAMVESFVDYGLALVKKVKNTMVEVVPLQRIAFCDQTDILAGPICELHQLNPDEVSSMKGWDEEAVKLALSLCKDGKMVLMANDQEAKTPGKFVQAYELNGMFPETWLNEYSEKKEGNAAAAEYVPEYSDSNNYVRQKHIVCYYYDAQNNKKGLTLFKGRVPKPIFKAIKRDEIFGRACGLGGVEELFDPQQWTNYSEIQLKDMLDMATLILLQTADEAFKGKNVINEVEKGLILTHKDNAPLTQVSITPQNKALFDQNVDRWNQSARTMGSADEALLGEAPAAGTPFSLQALIVQQGFGLHDYRKGKLAVFMAEIYRDWILQFLVNDMKKGRKWLSTLSMDEMQGLAENIVNMQTRKMYIAHILQGQLPTQQQVDQYGQQVKDAFMKGGGKKFLELVENEIDDIPIDVMVDIAGKQKDLNREATALTNIFRQVIANPQILTVPGMAKLFNEIIESSGFSPVDFSGITSAQVAPPAPAAPAAAPPGAPAAVIPQPA